jgi:LysR family hca operon transcriptional activator
MELRHLRYFVAVAEAGSLTVAAEQRLHTSQPSLSRQIRDLEEKVGAQLLTRRARGVELTPADLAFLDQARAVLSQVDAAVEAARRVAHPAKPCFTMGFLTGHELTWMPEALRILRDELPNIDVMISSQYSPLLADGLSKGKIDAAFLRREKGLAGVSLIPHRHRLIRSPANDWCLAGRTMCPAAQRGGGGLWPAHTAMRAPHSRAPQSARQEDRECCSHNHEIEPRAVQAEIHDRNKEQREHENPRYSRDLGYQLKSPVEARFRVKVFTLRSK